MSAETVLVVGLLMCAYSTGVHIAHRKAGAAAVGAFLLGAGSILLLWTYSLPECADCEAVEVETTTEQGATV